MSTEWKLSMQGTNKDFNNKDFKNKLLTLLSVRIKQNTNQQKTGLAPPSRPSSVCPAGILQLSRTPEPPGDKYCQVRSGQGY